MWPTVVAGKVRLWPGCERRDLSARRDQVWRWGQRPLGSFCLWGPRDEWAHTPGIEGKRWAGLRSMGKGKPGGRDAPPCDWSLRGHGSHRMGLNLAM